MINIPISIIFKKILYFTLTDIFIHKCLYKRIIFILTHNKELSLLCP